MTGIFRRFMILTLVLGGSSVPLFAQSTPNPMDVVLAYRGTWRAELDHLDATSGKSSRESSVIHNICWKSNEFAACNQVVNGESKILIVYTYNATESFYSSNMILPNGVAAGKGKLIVSGNTWIFPWQSEEQGKTTYYRVVNEFTSRTHIEVRQEYSTDKVHWTQTMRGKEDKISAE